MKNLALLLLLFIICFTCGFVFVYFAMNDDSNIYTPEYIHYDSETTKENEKKKAIEVLLNVNKLYQMENDQFLKFQKAFVTTPAFEEKQKYLDSMELSLQKSKEIAKKLKLTYDETYNKPNSNPHSD